MKKFGLAALLLISFQISYAQDYSFFGTMSREKLELYLSRAITMQAMVEDNVSSSVYTTQINMLADINARFIGRACGLWGGEGRINAGYFSDVSSLVSSIGTAYLAKGLVKPIVQAAIFEFVSYNANNIVIPAYVATKYGISPRNFNYRDMAYDDWATNTAHWWPDYGVDASGDPIAIVPDISKKETQMWFYFLATSYISKGIEAIHMGAIESMNDNDPLHINWWDLLGNIREYASTRNRRIVLLDAHTFGLYYQNTDQLLFDFHSSPIRISSQNPHWPSPAVNGGGALIPDNTDCSRPYRQTEGGKTYFGWYAKTLPYLVEFDNYGISTMPDMYAYCWYPWGWDEITWFALQSSSYRKNWLKYAYYKVKCLDENAFLEMPGMRGTTISSGSSPIYRAATGYYNDQTTIEEIWNGVYDHAEEFIHHNFTDEEVINPPSPPNVKSSLIFVGTDKAYYISTDGYIHGYIKDNGTPGIWRTVSPTVSAEIYHGQNVSIQVKASSDLVASPDGNTLIYKGTDGYIHGFTINNVWDYTYFNFPTSPMIAQNLKVEKDIVFASNSRVFYIANELSSGNKRIHGFIKSGTTWITTSPTHASSTPSSGQMTAAGALTYDANKNRLYYVGTDGFLYYHTIINDWTFTYNIVPQSDLISQSLRIEPGELALHGDRIYYIGHELINNKYRIHALINTGSAWNTLSPSHSAHIYNGQDINAQIEPITSSPISVSPNGKLVSYIGQDLNIHYYKEIVDGYNFSYNNTFGNPEDGAATNSLQFASNYKLFYVSHSSRRTNVDNKVHFYDLHESYCANPTIKAIEPNYTYISSELPINIENNFEHKETKRPLQLLEDIKVFPNPAKDELFVTNNIAGPVNYTIINSIGRVFLKGTFNEVKSDINISTLNSGIYFIYISDTQSNQVIRRKFSVVK